MQLRHLLESTGLAIHVVLLDVSRLPGFSLNELALKFVDFAGSFSFNVLHSLLQLPDLGGVVSALNYGHETALAVLEVLTENLLFGNLLLKHSKNFLLKLDSLLLVQLE